ncbi:MAG: hypothetical protein ABEL76_04175 [Bradymonadaceae bacterium]
MSEHTRKMPAVTDRTLFRPRLNIAPVGYVHMLDRGQTKVDRPRDVGFCTVNAHVR